MLLETLDIKKNDIVIYSQNLFDHDKNFRIVYKDTVNKESHKISFGEVCRYVNEYSPKNLIVYRLITNIVGFEIYVPKYGVFLNINGITEMIFFDPVYAVRELEEYSQSIDYNKLRFRIQQVGLTTLNRKGDLPNYAEIYSIDLEATEAKFQNDKVFADAIFSINKILKSAANGSDSVNNPSVKEIKQPVETMGRHQKLDRKIDNAIPGEKLNGNKEPDKTASWPAKSDEVKPVEFQKQKKAQSENQPLIEGIRIVRHDILEDKNFDHKESMKINYRGTAGLENKGLNPDSNVNKQSNPLENKSKDIPPKPNKSEQKTPSSFGKFLKEGKSSKSDKKISRQPGDENVSHVLDMFKSSSSSNENVKDREGKQIILKLDNK